jgi:N-acetylneuraminate lyase
MVDLQGCVAADEGAFDVLFGFDESLLAGLCLGARGAVGSTYNFAGPHYQRIIRAFESGDMPEARAAQLRATQLVKILGGFGFMAVMAMIGVDCGPVRPPIRNLAPVQLAALADKLAALDVFSRPLEPVE